MKSRKKAGFTLVEMLVVIAIIAVLAAVLMPVFSAARGKSYSASCLSGERQLGAALMQYAQDYDETMPNGINTLTAGRMWAGEGWAGQSFPYAKNGPLYHCPADTTTAQGRQIAVSYGYNYNLVLADDYEDDEIPPGVTLAAMLAPSRSVMLFEVAGVTVSLTDLREGADSPHSGAYFSASGNGLDNRLYAHKDWTTGIDNTYATGYLGGRPPFDLTATQFPSPNGRHANGSNYLLCDGHARWIPGVSVSSGLNALGENCLQDNISNIAGCGGKFYAAGTGAPGDIRATFTVH